MALTLPTAVEDRDDSLGSSRQRRMDCRPRPPTNDGIHNFIFNVLEVRNETLFGRIRYLGR
jgi:hypothetical protein